MNFLPPIVLKCLMDAENDKPNWSAMGLPEKEDELNLVERDMYFYTIDNLISEDDPDGNNHCFVVSGGAAFLSAENTKHTIDLIASQLENVFSYGGEKD